MRGDYTRTKLGKPNQVKQPPRQIPASPELGDTVELAEAYLPGLLDPPSTEH